MHNFYKGEPLEQPAWMLDENVLGFEKKKEKKSDVEMLVSVVQHFL